MGSHTGSRPQGGLTLPPYVTASVFPSHSTQLRKHSLTTNSRRLTDLPPCPPRLSWLRCFPAKEGDTMEARCPERKRQTGRQEIKAQKFQWQLEKAQPPEEVTLASLLRLFFPSTLCQRKVYVHALGKKQPAGRFDTLHNLRATKRPQMVPCISWGQNGVIFTFFPRYLSALLLRYTGRKKTLFRR